MTTPSHDRAAAGGHAAAAGPAAAVPVIAIDGPTASGKGTIAHKVAQALGFHYLDSGALYRLVALQALRQAVALDDGGALAQLVATLAPRFPDGAIVLAGEDVGAALRAEAVSQAASQVAVHASVRQALHALQLAQRQPPGLVADGRDMGTVVFPDARLKVFLTASPEARAERRHKQLIEKGIPAKLSTLLQDLKQRDARDSERSTAPLRAAQDAFRLDSSDLGVDEVVAQVLRWYREGLPQGL